MDPKRILVIEDESDVRELLKSTFKRAGYDVETADAAPRTVASLLVQRYDLLTLDLKMPDMDGADAASLARTLDERIPIVVVSGYLTPDLEDQLREMGIRHFVKKPFRTGQLLETVEEALQEHQQTET